MSSVRDDNSVGRCLKQSQADEFESRGVPEEAGRDLPAMRSHKDTPSLGAVVQKGWKGLGYS